jgi:proteasome accessory factor A
VALYDLAGERELNDHRVAFADRIGALLPTQVRFRVGKFNASRNGQESWGTHENYLTDGRVPVSRFEDELVSFLVTRPVIVGAGGLRWNGLAHEFALSPRGLNVRTRIAEDSHRSKPLVMLRDESHGRVGDRRLQIVSAEGNRFGVATYLKMGITSLVLRQIESDEPALRALSVKNAVDDLRTVAGGSSVHSSVFLHDGRIVSALDHQKLYVELTRDFLDRHGANAEELDVLDRWAAIVDDFESGANSLANRVEWVAKKGLLDRISQRVGDGYDSKRALAIDDGFVNIDGNVDVARRLAEAGLVEQIVSELEVAAARTVAPPTRAHARQQVIEFAEHRNLATHTEWSRIRFLTGDDVGSSDSAIPNSALPTGGLPSGGLPDIEMPDPYNPLPASVAHTLREIDRILHR